MGWGGELGMGASTGLDMAGAGWHMAMGAMSEEAASVGAGAPVVCVAAVSAASGCDHQVRALFQTEHPDSSKAQDTSSAAVKLLRNKGLRRAELNRMDMVQCFLEKAGANNCSGASSEMYRKPALC